MKKLILIALALMLAIVPSAWGASSVATYIVDGEEITTITEALDQAISDEATDVIIELSANEQLDETYLFDEDTSFTSVTLVGNGTTSLTFSTSAYDGVRHFVINNVDFTLGLRNITLDGGSRGGGIYVQAGTISADNVKFSNNDPTSNEDDESDRVGGAIHVGANGKATLISGSFLNNNSPRGGAICIDAGGSVSFTGTPDFDTNTTTGSGGAIYSAGELSFAAGGTFVKNKASTSGGAVHIASGGTNTFSGLTFGGNTSSYANSAPNGGAVSLASGTVTFTNSTFTNNSADQNGGAIYVDAKSTLNLDSGNTLNSNRAINGGAICLVRTETETDAARLNFTGNASMTFRGNNAKAGGAIYAGYHSALNSSVAITFDDNHCEGGNGGALWLYAGSQLSGFRSAMTFTNNTADYGGAIYIAIANSSTARFTSSGEYTFSGNTAEYEGGAIYTVQADVEIYGLNITDKNTAGTGGGLVRSGGTTTISGSTISNQTAQYGGAVYSAGKVTVNDSVFSSNSVSASASNTGGGAIFALSTLEVASSDFTRNTNANDNENTGGGAIFVSGDATLSDSTFSGNTQTNNSDRVNGGGAVYVRGVLTVSSCSFNQNKATGTGGGARGGAICAYIVNGTSTVSITNSLFNENTSRHNGGAIVCSGQYSTTIENCTFTGNYSELAGAGAIYPQGTFTVKTSYFYLNHSATNGGAILFDQHNSANNPGTFTAESCMFSENSAGIAPSLGQGGALYLTPDVAAITRCTFANNRSSASGGESRGGAIYLDTNNTAVFTASTIKNSTFYGNQVDGGSTNYGGAIFLTGEDIALISDTFTGTNSATGRGGAIYVGSGTTTIAACMLVGNVADNGRDVYAEGTITSRGYNRIGVYGKGGSDTSWLTDITTSTTDRENSAWTMTTFFGSDADLVDNDGYVQAPEIGSSLADSTVYLLAIPLSEIDSLTTIDRATNAIPFARRFTLNIDQYDIWSIDRFSSGNDISIGAHYLGGTGSSGATDTQGLYDIASISMSGIPNTLKSIGQTASLVAVIKYINGRTAYGVPASRSTVTQNQEERVVWSSSMPNFIKIDESGNITALQMTNNTNGATITVKTVRSMPSGSPATDSRAVKVTGQYSWMNTISPTYQNYFTDYVTDLMEHDISVAFADPDRSTVLATGFQRNFAKIWGTSKASAITDLSVSTPTFSTATSYSNSEGLAGTNGAAVSINYKDRSTGDLFPLTYSWNLSGAQVKALLGSDMSNQSINDTFAERLFNSLRIDYPTPTKNATVVGKNGVSGSDARRYGALTLTKADGNKGLHIELTAYLANVSNSSSSSGPQFVKGSGTKRLLIVPDGAQDGAITGTMWMAQSASTVVRKENSGSSSGGSSGGTSTNTDNNTSSSGGGGGGGCSSLGLGLLGAGLVFALKRR